MQHDVDQRYGHNGHDVVTWQKPAKADKAKPIKGDLIAVANNARESEWIAQCLTACCGMENPVAEVNALRALAHALSNLGTQTQLNLLSHYRSLAGTNPPLPESVHALVRDHRQ